jgi:hypothetical protein
MAQCITCGAELHPERAVKYNYCMAPACQEKNSKGLTMVAIGMNKAADELVLLDEHTRTDLANGRYQDQRRGSFGPPAARPGQPPAPAEATPTPAATKSAASASSAPRSAAPRRAVPAAGGPRSPGSASAPGPPPARPRWTESQERLALLYNQQGLRPAEIAEKLGVSDYLATQIILAARSRRKS